MTDPSSWPLARTETQTDAPPAGTLVMLIPPAASAPPTTRALEHLADDLGGDLAVGEPELLYVEDAEVQYHFQPSGAYSHTALQLNTLDVDAGDVFLLWARTGDAGAVWHLADAATGAQQLTDRVGLDGAGWAVLTAAVATQPAGARLVMAGDHTGSLFFEIRGLWRVNGAGALARMAMQAALSVAIDPESFPKPYSPGRVWSPGEHFHLDDAVYVVVEHSISVEPADVPASPRFRKILDGAAVRSDDIDSRIADWAEEGNDDPIPDSKLPAGDANPATGLAVIGGRGMQLVFADNSRSSTAYIATASFADGVFTAGVFDRALWDRLADALPRPHAWRSDRAWTATTLVTYGAQVWMARVDVPAGTDWDPSRWWRLDNAPAPDVNPWATGGRSVLDGEWAAGRSYDAGEAVTFRGHVFTADSSHTATAANGPAGASSVWTSRVELNVEASPLGIPVGSLTSPHGTDDQATLSDKGWLYFRGDYVQGTHYYPQNVVRSGGSSWVCLVEQDASTYQTPTNASTYWHAL